MIVDRNRAPTSGAAAREMLMAARTRMTAIAQLRLKSDRRPLTRLLAAAAAMLVCVSAGCAASAPGPRTTRLSGADLSETAAAMAQSLAESGVITGRSPQSPRWVVSIDRVENLSSDVLSESDKWSLMARLRSSFPIHAMRQQRNITFVIPAQRLAMLEASGYRDELTEAPLQRTQPTHSITAVLRSITRVDPSGKGRVDAYAAQFTMYDLSTQEAVWTDTFELKRLASGHIWD